MSAYYIHKCRLCCATFAAPEPTITHVCKDTPEEVAGGQADLLGGIDTTLDLTDPTKLHATLERLKFGEHVEQTEKTTKDLGHEL